MRVCICSCIPPLHMNVSPAQSREGEHRALDDEPSSVQRLICICICVCICICICMNMHMHMYLYLGTAQGPKIHRVPFPHVFRRYRGFESTPGPSSVQRKRTQGIVLSATVRRSRVPLGPCSSQHLYQQFGRFFCSPPPSRWAELNAGAADWTSGHRHICIPFGYRYLCKGWVERSGQFEPSGVDSMVGSTGTAWGKTVGFPSVVRGTVGSTQTVWVERSVLLKRCG